MRALTCLAAILVLFAAASAAEDTAKLERIKTALDASDYEAATKEFGLEVTAENANALKVAIAERLRLLVESRAVKTAEDLLPEPRQRSRREAQTELRLRALAANPEIPEESEVTEARVAELRAQVADRVEEEQAVRARILAAEKLLRDLQQDAPVLPGKLKAARARLESLDEAEAGPFDEFRKETVRLRIEALKRRSAFAERAPADLEKEISLLRKQADLAFKRLVLSQGSLAAASLAMDQDREREEKKARDDAAKIRADIPPEANAFERFESETKAEALELRADALDAGMALDDIRDLRAAEERAQNQLTETSERIMRWLENRRTTRKDADILLGKLDRLRDKETKLKRRLIPDLEELEEKYILKLSGAQTLLWDVDTPVEDLPERLDELRKDAPEDRQEDVVPAYRRYVTEFREPLAEYTRTLDELVREMEMVATIYAERGKIIQKTEAYIVGKMIWVRNMNHLGTELFAAEAKELRTLARTYAAPSLWSAVQDRFEEDAWRFALVLGGVVILGVLGIVFTLRLSRIQAQRQWRGGAFLALLQRLGLLVIISGIGPACLAAAGLLFYVLDLPDALDQTVARALFLLAQILFARRLLLRIFRPEGIAVTELSVSPEVAAQISNAVRWMIRLLLLLSLPRMLLAGPPHDLRHIPRVIRLVWFIALSWIVLYLMRPKRPLMQALMGESGFWRRTVGSVWPLLAIGALLMVAMSALGYQYGAELLAKNVAQTLAAAALLTVLYRFLTTIVRRAAKRAGIFRKDAKEEAIQQASRVFGYAAIGIAAFLLADFWGLTELLRNLLGGVRLTPVDVANDVYLTLWDIFVASLWVVGGHLLMRNLPGLYDLFLFPRMEKVDTGTRFVITTVSRYAVFLVVYSAALLALHFSFSSLGWLFAAASVGIGFGLQEIISNFISGLILFFERPVRVGDVVTVGTTTGTVESIAIRATHVTNFDRQVTIIPNRRFIVDDVINWSHNDLLIRRRVQVGVAYGTDVVRVAGMLEELAKAHPKVKSHPAPMVLFTAFGSSSLDMDLLIFIDIKDRNIVESQLKTQIAAKFAEEGVEIPFPQRDLHLRSVQDVAVITALKEREDRDAEDARADEADPEAGDEAGA